MDRFKKYVPLLVLILGFLSLVLALVFIKGKSRNQVVEEEINDELAAEIPFDKRPFVSLIPSKDGHWLKLRVEGIKIEADSFDYEILYQLPDGRTQGVPGTVKLTGDNVFERDILLGSESSGKYRYDEGVKGGTLTLRFRDGKGKLVGKLSTDFNLVSNEQTLSLSNSDFKYFLDEAYKDSYFVLINTFGVSIPLNFKPSLGPYGIFASDDKKAFPGKLSLDGGNIYRLENNSWVKIEDDRSSNIGIFVFE